MKNQIARILVASFLGLAAAALALGQTYTIQTVAGGGLPDSIPATSASLSRVTWVATDKAGNLYLTLPDHHAVMRVDAAAGVLTRVAGTGSAGFSGDNGPAASAQLANPGAIAVDPMGNLFIVDGNRVRMVHSGYITSVLTNLNGPSGLAVDASGNLYIAETGNNDVLKLSNGKITRIVGTGARGYNGDHINADAAMLNNPQGLAVDPSGRLFIADRDNSRIRKVENGMISTATAVISHPWSVAADQSNNVYIASDSGNRVFRLSGLISTTAGTGAWGFNGDGGPAQNAWLYAPQGLSVDASGSLYIADTNNFRVRKVSNGLISTVAGGGAEAGDGGDAVNAWLYRPTGIALDSTGNLFVADSDNYRVREVSEGIISTIGGAGGPGCGGDGGPALGAELRRTPLFHLPGEFQGLAFDAAGGLWIADSTCNSVRRIAAGTISAVTGGAQFSGPQGIAVDAAGAIYIADQGNRRIRKMANGTLTTVANGGSAPSGVAFDSGGNLYFADPDNHQVRRISNGVVTTVAGGGPGCDNCPATQAYLNGPTGIALDSAGALYIAEARSHAIRKVAGGVISTIAGNRMPGYGGDGGAALKAQLWSPEGLAIDSSGNIYVADTGNNRVRVLAPSGTPCVYQVSQSGDSVAANGGEVSATIQTAAGCAWAVQDLPEWLSLSGDPVSSGNGSVILTASANPGAARTAAVSVAGHTISISQQATLAVYPNGVVNAASYTGGAAVALGSIAAVFGSYLLNSPARNVGVPLPDTLAGLSLDFGNGVKAPLFYASDGQVNFQVPWELAGRLQTTVTARLNDHASEPQYVNLALYAPGIFTANGRGSGQGAIVDSSYRLTDAANPAARRSTVQIFCTGLGPVTNQAPTGSPSPREPLATTTTNPIVTIGGVPALVTFSGLAPDYVGLYQVNAVVPEETVSGSAVPVYLIIGGASSNTVTMAVQ